MCGTSEQCPVYHERGMFNTHVPRPSCVRFLCSRACTAATAAREALTACQGRSSRLGIVLLVSFHRKKKFDQRAVLRWFKISPLRTQKSWSNVRDNSAKIDFGRPGLGLWFRRDEFSMSFGLLVKETLFFTSSSVASSQLSLSIAYVVLREVAFPRAFALRARNEFRPTADPTRCALFG